MDKINEIKLKALNQAIYEAHQFIKKATKATQLKEIRGRDFAAAKRASLDLSMALVEVRRSPYEILAKQKRKN